jgi:alpha,alpha-trehalase
MATPQDVLTYIREHWDDSVRDKPVSDRIETMPFPYTSPCIEGHFVSLFYWDTYWANLGLLGQGRAELARSNTDNLLHLARTKGFVPNCISFNTQNRSQPPYLALMVRDVFEATGDNAWLAGAMDALETEMRFWQYQRSTPIGLNRHGHHAHPQYLSNFYWALVKRLGFDPEVSEVQKQYVAGHYLAEAETGWDFNPRFEGRCMDWAPVDLNSMLLMAERSLSDFARTLGQEDKAQSFARNAEDRIRLLQEYCWEEDRGLFLDYDCRNEKRSPVASLATVFPLWAGIATQDQASRVRENLSLFERAHGLAVCEQLDDDRYYQWGFPNAWPPLTHVAMAAMETCGFDEDADRIARTYVDVVCNLFDKTGQLWEKIDATTGEVAGGEYKAQPMLGWSAGAFIACSKRLGIC